MQFTLLNSISKCTPNVYLVTLIFERALIFEISSVLLRHRALNLALLNSVSLP